MESTLNLLIELVMVLMVRMRWKGRGRHMSLQARKERLIACFGCLQSE